MVQQQVGIGTRPHIKAVPAPADHQPISASLPHQHPDQSHQ